MKNSIKWAFLALLVLVATSTLKGQNNDKLWGAPTTDGHYSFSEAVFFRQIGQRAIMAFNYQTPPEWMSTGKSSPLAIYDGTTDEFIKLTTNWSDNPIDPRQVWMDKSGSVFITDYERLYKAKIYGNSIQYTHIFDASQIDKDFGIGAVCEVGDRTLIGAADRIVVLDKDYKLEKIIYLNTSYLVAGIEEQKGEVLVGIQINGPGGGVIHLDPETGSYENLPQEELKGNFDGCPIMQIEGKVYTYTNPNNSLFKNSGMLFRWEPDSGKWFPVAGSLFPKQNYEGKWTIRTGEEYISYTSARSFTYGEYYFENGKVMNLVPSQPLLKLGFEENTGIWFWQKYCNGNTSCTPGVSFVVDFGQGARGFGDHAVFTVVSSSGISEKPMQDLIGLYPNPATSVININSKLNGSDYVVTDMTGKTVMQGKVAGNPIVVNALTTGMYVIVLKNSSNFYSVRFIKQ